MTTWHASAERPLSAGDAGKTIQGRDQFGAIIAGVVMRDSFGIYIETADGLDFHTVPIARVDQYTLLDPPQS